jgi:hypothetical protein
MKSLKDLTKEQFFKLKESGMLYELYPEAPVLFDDIEGKKPIMIQNPDLTDLKRIVADYLNYVSSGNYHEDNDYEHGIYESVMTAFFKNDEFFKYLKHIND